MNITSIAALGRPLDSMDYLLHGCWRDALPDNEDTVEDFRFIKFTSVYDQLKLLGVYIGLIRSMYVGSCTYGNSKERWNTVQPANVLFPYPRFVYPHQILVYCVITP